MDRVAFSIFGIDVMWYGILMALGMIIGTLLAIKEGKRVGIKEDDILDLAIVAIPSGLIGARLYYVIFNWHMFSGDLLEILKIWNGGLAIHGGLIAGLITIIIYTSI